MVCIYCRSDMGVTNSRPQKSRNQVWRRRLCKACGAVFTSVEVIDLAQSLMVAKSTDSATEAAHATKSQMEPFDRDRLFISIYESLRHRPAAARDARGLADTVTAHIISASQHGLVPLRTITEIVLNTLRRFDMAAATHYGAFHPLS